MPTSSSHLRRRVYPKPPIVEAVVDLRFSEGTGGDILSTLSQRLGRQYSGEQKRQHRVEVSARIEEEAVATETRRIPHVTFLRSPDGLRLLGCGPDVLSVHVLAPYPGWESFIDQAKEAVGALYAGPHASATVATLTVRYIDRIELPDVGASFSDLLTVIPARPQGMPPQLAGLYVTMQTTDPGDGTTASLVVGSTPTDESNRPALIYDLSVQRSGQPLSGLEGDEWSRIAEDLHRRQREIFEASITDAARELFQ